jgi:nucleoside-diphosphate-sugar epimerase
VKIVVTGALGHIGSRLIRTLPGAFPDSHIVLVDSMMTQRYCSLFNLPASGSYQLVEMDVTRGDLRSVVTGAHAVVHLAAITDAAGSVDRAEQIEANNFEGTARVAEACVASGSRLITLSSTSVYGTQDHIVNEDCAELKPQSPYAATKLKEEALVGRLARERGLRAAIYRFGTIFGVSPGMRFHTAVNKFCWQAAFGQPVTVWRTAYNQKRPYLDLEDACAAIEHIIREDLFDGSVYNVLTVNLTVQDIVQQIRAFLPALEVAYVDSPIMNQLSYEVDDRRFRATGFTPSGSLERSIHAELALLNTRLTRATTV